MLPHLGQETKVLPTCEREGTFSSAERTFSLDHTKSESARRIRNRKYLHTSAAHQKQKQCLFSDCPTLSHLGIYDHM